MSKLSVSIAVLTYNHQKFLKQALDSFLIQKTSFDIEVIIGDDCSTDGTQEILKFYEEKHPNIFKVSYHSKNIGMLPNFISTLKNCSGKYIAFCEGDDYWTDSLKLQKQFDFLEKNSDYSICYHNVMVFDEVSKTLNEDTITTNHKSDNCDFTVLDLAKGNFMHTPSVFLKNDFILNDWFFESPIGDWPLYLTQIKDRKIKKLNDIMAVYRVHSKSAWSSKSELFKIKKTIKTIELIKTNIKLPKESMNQLNSQKQKLAFDYKKINNSYFKRLKRFLRNS